MPLSPYLARLRGEDPAPWEREFAAAKEAAQSRLWDAST